MTKKILFSFIIVNLGIIFGRFSGFFREISIADIFGVSIYSDIAIILLTLPDIIINLLIGGALSSSLIPYMASNDEFKNRIAYQAGLLFFLVFIFISVIFSINSEIIIKLIAPGFNRESVGLAIDYLPYVFYIIPLCVVTGVTTSYLNYNEKFMIPSLGTLFFNISLILSLYLCHFFIKEKSVLFVVIAIYSACIIRLLSQLLVCNIKFRPISSLTPWLINKKIINKYCQAMLSGSFIFVIPVAARSFSSYYGDGSVSIFNYAMRLVEFPLVITVMGISIVLLPSLAKDFKHDLNKFIYCSNVSIDFVIGVSIFIATVIFFNFYFFVDLIYSRNISDNDLIKIGNLFSIGLLGLVPQSLVIIFMTIFNSSKKTYIPLIINAVGICFFITMLMLFSDNNRDVIIMLIYTYSLMMILYLIAFKIEFKNTSYIKLLFKNLLLFIIIFILNYYSGLLFGENSVVIKFIINFFSSLIFLLLVNYLKIKEFIYARF